MGGKLSDNSHGTPQGSRLRFSGLAIVAVALALVYPSCLEAGGAPPQFEVWHEPYLQPGPAAETPDGTDSVEIRWQTRPMGTGTEDSFAVFYTADTGRWAAAPPAEPRPTGYQDRVVHVTTISGLEFGTAHEYRVFHLRRGRIVTAYGGEFDTRLSPGDETPFTFAAYGDSACGCDIAPFRRVQATILSSDAAFALLLGDNAYEEATHDELDARFTRMSSPEGSEWRADHIDFAAFGNHDIVTDSGLPSRQVFGFPGSPIDPPASEPPGHNYSFDYGIAHFVTFDSNAFMDPLRLGALIEWLVDDLAASDATWKIVFAHHPVSGGPDKPDTPGDDYFVRLVPRLVEEGVDLFLVGHSHTFAWTFPLTGVQDGAALFVPDGDRRYLAGDGVVQVIAGTSGKTIRPGQFTSFPFVARGYSADTDPPAEYGFALVEVHRDHLVVSYVSAEDGRVIDSFTIEEAPVRVAGWLTSDLVAA